MVTNPGFGVFEAKEDERGIACAIVVLAQTFEMFPSRLANLIGDAVVHAGTATQDKPTVPRPPGSGLEQRVLKQFLPNIFGGCGAKPELPVLLGGKREWTHMGLIVYARRKVPGGDRRKVVSAVSMPEAAEESSIGLSFC